MPLSVTEPPRKCAKIALVEDRPRPWDEWFAAIADTHSAMTAEQALQQAEQDGLPLRRSSRRIVLKHTEAESKHYSHFWNVKKYDFGSGRHHFKACISVLGSEFHINYSETEEEAALHVARFAAYPLGVVAARRMLVEARQVRDERSSILRAARNVSHAQARELALRAREAERVAEREGRRAAKAASEEAARVAKEEAAAQARAEASVTQQVGKAARQEAREERARAKQAARVAAKRQLQLEREQAQQWATQRRAELAGMQRQQLREAASQQAAKRTAGQQARAPGTVPGQSSHSSQSSQAPGDAGAAALERIEEWSIAALVQHVLGARHDPWHCLGLDVGRPPEAVRKRYLHLALRLHPDKASGVVDAKEAFTVMEAAFRTVYS